MHGRMERFESVHIYTYYTYVYVIALTRPHTDVSLYLSGFYLTTDADYRYPLLLLLLS